MRVTFNMMTGRVFDNLMTSSARLMEAQNRASSGKRIQLPSDDVSGTGMAMNLRETVSALKQYERNSTVAKSHLTATSHYLDTISGLLHDIRNLALQSCNATITDEARGGIVLQLEQIETSLIAAGNAKFGSKYVFAGSKADAPPLVPNGAPGVPYTYEGDTAEFKIQVAPWTSVVANATGDTIFNIGGGAVPGSPDVFQTIQLLIQEIRSGDTEAVSARISDVRAHMDNVTGINSQVGARLNRLESTMGMVLDSQVVFRDLLSQTEDIDLAEAVIELRTRENIYQSAIATSTRVLQLTLADYLR